MSTKLADTQERLRQHERLLARLAQEYAELDQRLDELEARLPEPAQPNPLTTDGRPRQPR